MENESMKKNDCEQLCKARSGYCKAVFTKKKNNCAPFCMVRRGYCKAFFVRVNIKNWIKLIMTLKK